MTPVASAANHRVSVIVPVYNVEQYIAQCLDSIVAQTHRDLEILLVNDGSTDGSGCICDEYATRDSRIRVIHKPNGGLSDARNAALDVMTGDCVVMIDGDDMVHPRYVERLLAALLCSEADVAMCGWRSFDETVPPTPPLADGVPPTIYSGRDALQRMLYQRKGFNHSACWRMFKSEFWKNIRFPKGLLYEDLAVIYPLMCRVNKVAVIPDELYDYRLRAGSITKRMSRRRTDVLDILDALEKRVSAEDAGLLPAVRSRRLSASFNLLLLCADEAGFEDVSRRCWDGIKTLRMGCLADARVRLKNKAGIVCSFLGRRLFTALFRHVPAYGR